MDLYDIESGTTLPAELDHLIMNFGGKHQVILWVVNDVLFPEIVHDFEEPEAVEFGIAKKVMELIERYEEDSE